MMWSEARMARQRINAKAVQDALVLQSAISTVMGGKKAHSQFSNLLDRIKSSD
jgi:hypothetical protein